MPASVTFDPTVPLGTESLKTGPARIKTIPSNILGVFGQVQNVRVDFKSPMDGVFDSQGAPELTLANHPTQDLSAATKFYADRRTPFITVVGDGSTPYLQTAGPNLAPELTPTVPSNAVYIVLNAGSTNAGVVAIGEFTVVRADGTAVQAGDFPANAVFLLAWDGAALRVITFVSRPLSAQASVTMVIPRIDVPQNTDTEILALDLTFTDGPFLVFVEYAIYLDILTGFNGPVFGRVTDGTADWAISGDGTSTSLHGTGYRLTSSPVGTTVHLSLRIFSSFTSTAAVDNPGTLLLPPTYLRATAIRTAF